MSKTVSLCVGSLGYMSEFSDSWHVCVCHKETGKGPTWKRRQRRTKMSKCVYIGEYQQVTCVAVGGLQYISVTKTCTCVKACERRALTVSGKTSICAAKSTATEATNVPLWGAFITSVGNQVNWMFDATVSKLLLWLISFSIRITFLLPKMFVYKKRLIKSKKILNERL